MKKRFFLTITLLIFITSGFAQYAKEVPNYLFAENANFIVNIISMESMVQDEYVVFNTRNNSCNFKEYDENMKLKFLETAGKYINNQLISVDLQPQTVIFMDFTKMQNAEELKEIGSQYNDIKPKYLINIVVSTWGKNLKNYTKKGEFKPERIKPVSFSISQYGESDPSKIYSITKANLSLADALEIFSRQVIKKRNNKSYFVDTIENVTQNKISLNKVDTSYIDKLYKVNKTLNIFPDEDLLKNDTILVLINDKVGSSNYLYAIKMMDKFYPYNYIIKSTNDSPEELKKDYNYVIVAKYYMKNVVKNSTIDQGKTKSYKALFYYYGLKDLDNLTMYYGADEDYFRINASEKPAFALKFLLKRMKKFYDWEKN